MHRGWILRVRARGCERERAFVEPKNRFVERTGELIDCAKKKGARGVGGEYGLD